jgi:hypothetical protein
MPEPARPPTLGPSRAGNRGRRCVRPTGMDRHRPTAPTTRRARRIAATAAAVALALGLAACGDDDDGDVVAGDGTATTATGGDTTPSSDGTAGGATIPHPTEPDAVVVRVLVGGGFVPVEQSLATIASSTLLGDGTLVTAGPVPLIYPGPAIQPLQSTVLGEEQVQALLARADELGLLDGPLDFGTPNVADAPSTTVTFVVDGRTIDQTANALGMEGMDDTVGEDQQANRAALQEFLDALAALPAGDEVVTPPAVAVFALGAPVTDPDLPQEPVDWPLATPPASDGTDGGWPCTLVTGADVDTLLAALEGANAATPWVIDGVETALAFRPVLPGDAGCPS